jgi:hypothetical protein
MITIQPLVEAKAQQVDGVCCDLTSSMPSFGTNPSNTKN